MSSNKKVIEIIENLSDIISILLELKRQGRFETALKKLDEVFIQYFDFDSKYICSVSEDLLIDVLQNEKEMGLEELRTIAELLNEFGDILLEQNNLKKCRDVLKNSLKIYYFLNEEQDFFSFKSMNKMLMINEKLNLINMKIKS